MNPVSLQAHLREIGVPPQRGRTSAIRQLVLRAPAPVITKALGYHDKTATRDNDEERSTITTLLHNAAAAGQIDPALDPDNTAAWVMALIAALYTSAATDPSFTPAAQLPTLCLILHRFLRPNTHQEPER